MSSTRLTLGIALALTIALVTPAAAQTCCPPPCGRVAWWPANGNALDSLGLHNGIAVTGTGYTRGRDGQAFSFDGISGRVDLGSDPLVGSGSDPFTVSLWVKLLSIVDEGHYIFLARLRHESQFILAMSENFQFSGSLVSMSFRGLNHQFSAPVDWCTFVGDWAHVAAVYNGGDKNSLTSYQLYVNGVPLALVDYANFVAGTDNDNGIAYDPFPGTGRDMLRGAIDDVQLFNRALSQAEIDALVPPIACSTAVDAYSSSGFSLRSASNPTQNIAVEFDLPLSAPAYLEVLDVTGRRVDQRFLVEVTQGHHVLDLGVGKRLPAGVYVVRLTQGAASRKTQVTLLR